jgi:hypothetical protein
MAFLSLTFNYLPTLLDFISLPVEESLGKKSWQNDILITIILTDHLKAQERPRSLSNARPPYLTPINALLYNMWYTHHTRWQKNS